LSTARAGTLLALAVAGWPLYQLVSTGGLDLTSALLRGIVVAVVCAYGVGMIVRLALRFEAEVEAQRKKRLDSLYTDMQGAVTDGILTDPDEAEQASRPEESTSS
jgi:hypothetical protein